MEPRLQFGGHLESEHDNAGRYLVRPVKPFLEWAVMSPVGGQKTSHKVVKNGSRFHCTCQAHSTTYSPCDHIWAVTGEAHKDDLAELAKFKRKDEKTLKAQDDDLFHDRPFSHKKRNWADYRQKRVAEKPLFKALLADLVGYVEAPNVVKRGRRVDYRSAVTAILLKTYVGEAADTFKGGDFHDAQRAGLIEDDCCSNTILNHMGRPEMEGILQHLIAVTCRPLAELEDVVAIDSTGFTGKRFVTHTDVKYRGKKERRYLMAHMACGLKTKAIVSVEISDMGDARVMPHLFYETQDRVRVSTVLADKAYGSNYNFEMLSAAKVRAFIDHKVTDTGAASGNAFKESLRFYRYHTEEFMREYHQRSLIESAFSMIKRNFGSHLVSKAPQAMRNEILCKVVCHNIVCLISSMDRLKVAPDFTGRTVH